MIDGDYRWNVFILMMRADDCQETVSELSEGNIRLEGQLQ